MQPIHFVCRVQANDIVGPSHLRKGLFRVGAMDNIDHDPFSITAQSSFMEQILASHSFLVQMIWVLQ